MELGGSDPFIVLDDCDLEDEVKMAVVGRIGNASQTCIGAKRFIFIGPRLKEFLAIFRAALEPLKIGDPFDENRHARALVVGRGAHKVREAVSHGAKILTDIVPGLMSHIAIP